MRQGDEMRLQKFFLPTGMLLMAVACSVLALVCNSKNISARSFYDQIAPEMTRSQVKELMRDAPVTNFSHYDSLDGWQISGKCIMIVKFSPDYDGENGLDQTDPRGENWRATEVMLLDFSNPNPMEQLLERLGLWSRSKDLSKSFRRH